VAARPHPIIRYAVYTRKSTKEGLEQEFNSLDAQREAGENYIASQKSQGCVKGGVKPWRGAEQNRSAHA